MKIYFLRHAPTQSNMTGSMVRDYAEESITGEIPKSWDKEIGSHIPQIDINTPIISSPAKRCRETSELLFKIPPMIVLNELDEFDCHALNDLKFWEVTQEEFEERVKLKAEDMEKQVDSLFKFFNSLNDAFSNIRNIICISHGMVIRYIYHYLMGNRGIMPYDVINSKGFKFYNLDLLVYDTLTKKLEDYHNSEHITHF